MGRRIVHSERTKRVVYAFSAMALLLLLMAASPLMLKEGTRYLPTVNNAYAATDTTDPTVTITKPTGYLSTNTMIVRGTAWDNSGGSKVKTVEVKVDGDSDTYKKATPKATGDWSTWSVTISIPSNGPHTLTARATDNAGNQNWDIVTINIDTTDPSVTITKPTGYLSTNTMIVRGTAWDNSGGSKVKTVEVKVDSSSTYKKATPKATGDWSTWSVTISIPSNGPHTLTARATDNAGNQNWDTSSITIGGGSTTDTFGVKMLYPTKAAGEQWFIDMADPEGDSRFDPKEDISKNADGSWKIKSSEVRMNVFTSTDYDPDKITTYTQNQLATKGYMQDPRDWKNIEMTGYVKVNSASDDNISWYGRGGKHSDEDCEGTAYKSRLFYYSGETGFAKEQWHSGGYSFTSSEEVTTSIMDRWIGFKFVMYNTVQNGKTVVVLENWLNDNGDKMSSWEKVASTVDDGGWGDEGDHCSGSPDQIMTWGGPITTFRWDDASDVDFKWLSVREIQPPS